MGELFGSFYQDPAIIRFDGEVACSYIERSDLFAEEAQMIGQGSCATIGNLYGGFHLQYLCCDCD